MDQAVWASRASLVVGLRPQLDRRDPAAVIRARFNETTKVRTKSDDSDSDFRWLKLFFSSRDSCWSPTGDESESQKLMFYFCESDTHLVENAQMVDGEGCTNSLLRTSSF